MTTEPTRYTTAQLLENKKKIIALFGQNVKGKTADVSLANIKHDGKSGHWLERMMGVKANGNNAPDLLGYEMKNNTGAKTSFGDWSADYRIFGSAKRGKAITQDQFLTYFGHPNPKKDNRFAWSGSIVPKITGFNYAGQKLVVDAMNNIVAIYSYSEDQRIDKSSIVPTVYQVDNLILAKWSAEYIQKRVNKFENGWFKCFTDKNGVYSEIAFGGPISFTNFIDGVKSGDIYFDSGMYQGNVRPYATWRANNSFWNKLITSRY